MTCAIFGENPDELEFGYDEDYPTCAEMKYRLVNAMQQLIAEGCTRFVTTLEQGAAMWGAEACAAINELGGSITLIAAPLHEDQANRWHPERRERYYRLIETADELIDPLDDPSGEAYIFENADVILMLGDTVHPRLSSILRRAESASLRILIA